MKINKIVFWVVSAIVLAVAILVSVLLKTDRIYTHFFYIPIALSAVVFPKYTILMGIGLAALHLLVEVSLRDNLEIISLLRAGIMILVSYFLHVIWHKERDYRQRIDNFDYHRYNDGLTGAYNQRHLNELDVDRLWYPLSMIHVKLDKYLDLKLKYGQKIADVYVAELGKVLRESIRGDDQLIRIEEYAFIILLEHTDSKAFVLVKERIHKSMDKLSIATLNPDLFPEPLLTSTKEMTTNDAKGFNKAYDIVRDR